MCQLGWGFFHLGLEDVRHVLAGAGTGLHLPGEASDRAGGVSREAAARPHDYDSCRK